MAKAAQQTLPNLVQDQDEKITVQIKMKRGNHTRLKVAAALRSTAIGAVVDSLVEQHLPAVAEEAA
jgi:hypothetical protein